MSDTRSCKGRSWADIKELGAELWPRGPQIAQELVDWPTTVVRAVLADPDRACRLKKSFRAASISTSYSGFDRPLEAMRDSAAHDTLGMLRFE